MSEFHERTPLSVRLDEEYRKIPESGPELAKKVNDMVTEIKKTKDGKKKQEMLDKLIIHIHPLLAKHVSAFYKKFHYLLSKQGFTKGDVYSQAVMTVMKYVDKREDRGARKAKRETPTNFTTYVFNKFNLYGWLKKEFVRPAFTDKRTGQEISMNQPVPGFKQEEGRDLEDILPDQKAEDAFSRTLKNEEIKIGKNAVLEKLYDNKNPFLSLMVMMRFGFDKSYLDNWKSKFDSSVRNGEIGKLGERHLHQVDQAMKEYKGEEMTLQEIGSLFGFSRENVRQRLDRAMVILREKL